MVETVVPKIIKVKTHILSIKETASFGGSWRRCIWVEQFKHDGKIENWVQIVGSANKIEEMMKDIEVSDHIALTLEVRPGNVTTFFWVTSIKKLDDNIKENKSVTCLTRNDFENQMLRLNEKVDNVQRAVEYIISYIRGDFNGKRNDDTALQDAADKFRAGTGNNESTSGQS